SGLPFDDPSGDRLRAWLGLDRATFYDEARIAFLPMGLCFPGHDAKGGDLPPRPECAPRWRASLLAALPAIEVALLIGLYAQRWHLPRELTREGLTVTVARWREIMADRVPATPLFIPLPHPSWRNSGWLKRHRWFEAELVPELQDVVARTLNQRRDMP
ncbi:MAG TPA: uracil-DNA glycosylase family protein, partial [Hyphomicrobiaceae bacterium]|nr:uracil-DNA glycosylase family protein [Hyphomicrobiaceae bacterium]